ncbi:MAG: hypothetical protein ACJ77M_09940, partial [Thermoleophilaceae bacterium]
MSRRTSRFVLVAAVVLGLTPATAAAAHKRAPTCKRPPKATRSPSRTPAAPSAPGSSPAPAQQPAADAQASPPGPLAWAPPALSNPTTIDVTRSDQSITLDQSRDYVIELPPYPLVGR